MSVSTYPRPPGRAVTFWEPPDTPDPDGWVWVLGPTHMGCSGTWWGMSSIEYDDPRRPVLNPGEYLQASQIWLTPLVTGAVDYSRKVIVLADATDAEHVAQHRKINLKSAYQEAP